MTVANGTESPALLGGRDRSDGVCSSAATRTLLVSSHEEFSAGTGVSRRPHRDFRAAFRRHTIERKPFAGFSDKIPYLSVFRLASGVSDRLLRPLGVVIDEAAP